MSKTITLWTTTDRALGGLKKGDAWPQDGWDGTYFWPEEGYDSAFENAIATRGVLIRVTAEVMDAEVEWVAEPPPKPPKPSDIEAAKAAINHAQVACASALGLPLGANVDAGDGSPVFAALAQAYAVLCERERSQHGEETAEDEAESLRMISRQKETTP
jgi:hypothetical protein